MRLRLTGRGTRPLLMHNIRLASPLDPYARKLKTLNAKRSAVKTDEDRIEIARVEWEGGLYWEPGIGPHIPLSWIFKGLIEGARLSKAGKKIERGVIVANMMHPLIYSGPRDLDSMWGDGSSSRFVDMRTVRVGAARVDRCRPIFPEWTFEADLEVDPSIIDLDELREIARQSGQLVGMGDYRMMFGRFAAEVEPI